MSAETRKKILFDLDDTLLDFRTAERNSILQTFEEFGIPSDEAVLRLYSEINLGCWQRLELGEMTREEVLVGRFERLFAEMGLDLPARPVQDRYEALLESGHYFIPGAPELLEELVLKYDLYLISNGNLLTQESRLKSAGIAPYFRDIFISEQIGANKPSKAFFDACFSAIPGFCREDAVIVGDSLSSDIRGGINAGVRTCWFNPDGAPAAGDIRPDYEFRTLSELPALLEKIFQK
ncbi:MAG: YjjG family noncanonical pyrimidine nucleotidase [Oscillospiraceae bacterium]|nr:YjjG family noncanonical pyrimidine nucleotidase [Oscillospiraceae bacterium]